MAQRLLVASLRPHAILTAPASMLVPSTRNCALRLKQRLLAALDGAGRQARTARASLDGLASALLVQPRQALPDPRCSGRWRWWPMPWPRQGQRSRRGRSGAFVAEPAGAPVQRQAGPVRAAAGARRLPAPVIRAVSCSATPDARAHGAGLPTLRICTMRSLFGGVQTLQLAPAGRSSSSIDGRAQAWRQSGRAHALFRAERLDQLRHVGNRAEFRRLSMPRSAPVMR